MRELSKAPTTRWGGALLLAGVMAGAVLLAGCERTEAVQRGYRGTSAMQMYKPAAVEQLAEINKIPEPEDPVDFEGPLASETFKNVKVVGDLTALEFSRLMQAMSTWIAPDEGCDFCHNPKKLESDEKYPKVVARRMLQMTRQINTDWKPHVGAVGVTCWTCHRGQAVPSGDWFSSPVQDVHANFIGERAGQNTPGPQVGGSSLPTDPLSTYLVTASDARVQGTQVLAGGNRHSIKQAESTYALMMYISQSLGVNCTYCHVTRAFGGWEDQSTPQRGTAWYGIRMVRTLNTEYLNPIAQLLPAYRLSPEGDGPKVGCATCHKGTHKPMYGVTMLNDYPALAGVMAPPPPEAAPEPAPAKPGAPARPGAPPAAKPAVKAAAAPAAKPAASADAAPASSPAVKADSAPAASLVRVSTASR